MTVQMGSAGALHVSTQLAANPEAPEREAELLRIREESEAVKQETKIQRI